MENSRKRQFEEERILWRASVLAAGGQDWLIQMARLHKFRERDIGPNLVPPPELRARLEAA